MLQDQLQEKIWDLRHAQQNNYSDAFRKQAQKDIDFIYKVIDALNAQPNNPKLQSAATKMLDGAHA